MREEVNQVRNHLAAEGLIVLTASDPSFSQEVDRLLGSNAADFEKVRPILTRSQVVVNGTGNDVLSFTVLYTYPDVIMGDGTPMRLPVSATAIGPDLFAHPGHRFLITPVSDLYASMRPDGTSVVRPMFDPEGVRFLQWYIANYLNKRVEISVDSIIYSDRMMVGPDTIGRLDRLNRQLRAEGELHDRLSGLHGSELRRTIEAAAVNDSRGQTRANALLELLNREGEASFVHTMEDPRWKEFLKPYRRREK